MHRSVVQTCIKLWEPWDGLRIFVGVVKRGGFLISTNCIWRIWEKIKPVWFNLHYFCPLSSHCVHFFIIVHLVNLFYLILWSFLKIVYRFSKTDKYASLSAQKIWDTQSGLFWGSSRLEKGAWESLFTFLHVWCPYPLLVMFEANCIFQKVLFYWPGFTNQ